MEKITKDQLQKRVEQIKQQGQDNKGKEYKYLWVSVSFAVVKDLHIRKIGARAFGIFMIIRAYMDKEGIAFPSLATIAYQAGCSVRTVQKDIELLIRHQWIKKVGRVQTENGKFGNTKYTILERDLIRGTGQKGFIQKPVANYASGD